MSEKYGNENFWCFFEGGWAREIAIWKGPEDKEIIIAHASDKYDAKLIIDALLAFNNKDELQLSKKEQMFLEFVKASCPEPYATMAANAILWADRETYNKLLSEFPTLYR